MSDFHPVIVIQARSTSTRLPGKVMRELLPGMSMLRAVYNRCLLSELAKDVVLAIPEGDEALFDHVAQWMPYDRIYTGSEHDVLARFAGVLGDPIVRITADCPFVWWPLIDTMLDGYQEDGRVQFATNVWGRTFPKGLDVEIIGRRLLRHLNGCVVDTNQREHVTKITYDQLIQRIWKANDLISTRASQDLSHINLSVDTQEDFDFAKRIYEHFNTPYFTIGELLLWLESDKPAMMTKIA